MTTDEFIRALASMRTGLLDDMLIMYGAGQIVIYDLPDVNGANMSAEFNTHQGKAIEHIRSAVNDINALIAHMGGRV